MSLFVTLPYCVCLLAVCLMTVGTRCSQVYPKQQQQQQPQQRGDNIDSDRHDFDHDDEPPLPPQKLSAAGADVWRPDRWAPEEIDVVDLLDKLRLEASRKHTTRTNPQFSAGGELLEQRDLQEAAADKEDSREWLEGGGGGGHIDQERHAVLLAGKQQQSPATAATLRTAIQKVFGSKLHPTLTEYHRLLTDVDRNYKTRQPSGRPRRPQTQLSSTGGSGSVLDPALSGISSKRSAETVRLPAARNRNVRRQSDISLHDVNDLHPVYLGMGPRAVEAAMLTLGQLINDENDRRAAAPKMSTRFIG